MQLRTLKRQRLAYLGYAQELCDRVEAEGRERLTLREQEIVDGHMAKFADLAAEARYKAGLSQDRAILIEQLRGMLSDAQRFPQSRFMFREIDKIEAVAARPDGTPMQDLQRLSLRLAEDIEESRSSFVY